MSDSTSEVRCAAMLMLFDAYSAKCAEVEVLRELVSDLQQFAPDWATQLRVRINAALAAGEEGK